MSHGIDPLLADDIYVDCELFTPRLQSLLRLGRDECRMKQRGRNLRSKRSVNMSFSELVQRIVQNDTNATEQYIEKFHRAFWAATFSRIILRLAIARGNLVLPRMPRIFKQNGSYQRPCRGIFVL